MSELIRKAVFFVFVAAIIWTVDGAQAQDLAGGCHLDAEIASKSGAMARFASTGAAKRFPTSGTVNALIIFVQHINDTFRHCGRLDGYSSTKIPQLPSANYASNCASRPGGIDSWTIGGYQSWTDNTTSEWPANLAAGPDPNRTRVLPAWAEDLIDPPGSTTFTTGSLSDYYNRMSNGDLTLTGEVWDYTYVPEHNWTWYNQPANRTPFANGAVKLSHEIISYVDANPHGLDFTSSIWDQYTNGDGTNLTPDGNFDMILLVYRFSKLTELAPVFGAANVTSLGSNATFGNSFSPSPLSLGSYDVIDNYHEG